MHLHVCPHDHDSWAVLGMPWLAMLVEGKRANTTLRKPSQQSLWAPEFLPFPRAVAHSRAQVHTGFIFACFSYYELENNFRGYVVQIGVLRFILGSYVLDFMLSAL